MWKNLHGSLLLGLTLASADAEGLFFLRARDLHTVREDLQALLDHAGTGARLRFVPGRLAGCALRGMELAAVVPLSEWHYMSAAGKDSVVDISWYVATMHATGAARTTHPVPLVHRVLKGLSWILPR